MTPLERRLAVLTLGTWAKKPRFSLSAVPDPLKRLLHKATKGTGLFGSLEDDLSQHLNRKVRLFDTEKARPAAIQRFLAPDPKAELINVGTPVTGLPDLMFGRRMRGSPVNNATRARAWEDKAQESKFLKGIIPDAISVPDLMKELGINMRNPDAGAQLLAGARKRYGNDFLFKPRISHQSISSTFPTARSSPEELISKLRSGVLNSSNERLARGYRNWVVQKKMSVKPQGVFDRILGRLAPGIGSGAREYRVHTLGNRVIPGASVFRGGLRQVLPWQTAEMRMVEKQMQQLLKSRMRSEHGQTPFAFDVLIGKNNKIVPIESNPATLGGASGLAEVPHVVDAIASFAAGKTPLYIQRQRALENVGRNTARGLHTVAPGVMAATGYGGISNT